MKIISLIFFLKLSTVVFSQINYYYLISKVSETFKSYKTYKSEGTYKLVSPSNSISLSFSILIQKGPIDSLDNLSYVQEYNSIEGKQIQFYSNKIFYMTLNGDLIKKSALDEPKRFKDIKRENSIIPAIYKTPITYPYTPIEFAKFIDQAILDRNCIINQKKDTIINNQVSLHFVLSRNYTSTSHITDLYVEKSKLFPLMIRKSLNSQVFSSQNRSELVLFTNTEINLKLPDNYFDVKKEELEKKYISQKPDINAPGTLVGSMASNWQFPILGENKLLSLKDLKGKTILIEFTSTWCLHCKDAMPMMNHLKEKFKTDTTIYILSIFSSKRDNENAIRTYVENHLLDTKVLYNAEKAEKDYNLRGYPAFFIIDSYGRIKYCIEGYSDSLANKLFEELSKIKNNTN